MGVPRVPAATQHNVTWATKEDIDRLCELNPRASRAELEALVKQYQSKGLNVKPRT